ncbi:unnamed protein product, partial [Mesorhabditis spiculigera]
MNQVRGDIVFPVNQASVWRCLWDESGTGMRSLPVNQASVWRRLGMDQGRGDIILAVSQDSVWRLQAQAVIRS